MSSLLFDTPLIAGLRYAEELIDADAEQALIDRVAALDLAPFRFHGWLGNRKTHSFGWRYDFDDASFTPGDPIPAWLYPLRDKAAAFAASTPENFVHALVARYDPGAGIGWHRDRDVFEQVVGISLGSPATLRFRQRTPGGFRRASIAACAALGLSAVGRGAARLGAQHRAGRAAALLDHLPHPVAKGPRHRQGNGDGRVAV